MSDNSYLYDLPQGRKIEPEPPTHAFGQRWPTATPEALAICESLGLRELSPENVDFEKTTRRKLWIKGDPQHRRYYPGTFESALAAGVGEYFVQAPGYLVLLARPGSQEVVTERLGDLPRGRKASPDLRIRPAWTPGSSPVLPRR